MTVLCLALLVPSALLAAGLTPYSLFVVHTGSMEPSIPSNSVIVVRKGVYLTGQPITFRTDNGVVTHRLVLRKLDGTLVTRGDANTTDDPGVVSKSDVIGGVVAVVPFAGFILVFLKGPIGLAALLGMTVCLMLLRSLRRGPESV